MNKKELQELRGNKIAMIFQDPMTSLDPLFTVEYQLNESLKKHTNLDAVARKARMIELLTLVGINRRNGGSNSILTSFPAACVRGS